MMPMDLHVTQAERLRSLGWGDFLKVEMSRDRKTLSVSYWM
jgi:mediator of RNA polymerase II transcription subunit 14